MTAKARQTLCGCHVSLPLQTGRAVSEFNVSQSTAMTRMTLYSGPLSMFGGKAQIACLEKSLPFDLVMVAYTREQGYEPKHPEVLRINPKRQVPVLIDGAV